MIKKLLSYFVPYNIWKQKSKYSQTLEITWNNGKLVLDTENTNYSYGALQKVLRIGLKHIGFNYISQMNDILILGLGGGSIVETINNELNFSGKITAVEIDSDVVSLGEKYFELAKHTNLKIVIDDAQFFVKKDKKKYQLIVIDIFQDSWMPGFLFDTLFINKTINLLDKNGFILFNTMCLNKMDNERNQNFINKLNSNDLKVWSIPRIEVHNELIFIQKLK